MTKAEAEELLEIDGLLKQSAKMIADDLQLASDTLTGWNYQSPDWRDLDDVKGRVDKAIKNLRKIQQAPVLVIPV